MVAGAGPEAPEARAEDRPRRHIRRAGTLRNAAVLAALAVGLAGAFSYVALSRPQDVQAAMERGRYDVARELLLPRAEAGDTEAQNALGNLYYLGLGGPTDYDRAADWYLKAALAGSTDAQINVSQLYGQGNGVPRDKMRAYAWLLHARRGGNEAAENHIKWRFGRSQLTIYQLEMIKERYAEVKALDPANDRAAGASGATR